MTTNLTPPAESVVDRFLRYVRIDTQSRDGVDNTPSTDGQWALVKLLADELRALGAADVFVNEHCTVYAAIPANTPDAATIPVLGFLAHVDTSPAVSGAGVNPVIHRDYRGGDIHLPGDPAQVIRVDQHPVLQQMIGDDIITTDGTTLLGSDDKAGVAAIMTMVDLLARNPQVKHGRIAVAFTPDEEIGSGIERFDLTRFGAGVAYTVDGEGLGEINDETFSARLATLIFHGKSAHPGTAKGVMVELDTRPGRFSHAAARGVAARGHGRTRWLHASVRRDRGRRDLDSQGHSAGLRDERAGREGAAVAHPG